MKFSREQGFLLPGIDDRVTVVTGGARGIGKAIALLLADQGANVHVLDLTLPPDGERHPSLSYHMCDVGDTNSVDAAVAEVEGVAGSVEILINNAGILRQAEFEHTSIADWERMLRVNLTAGVLCTQRVLPGMRRARYGRIVFIGSSAGKQGGGPGLAAYAASKAGVLSLAKSLAKDYSREGITANAIAPAAIATEMIRNLSGFDGGASLPIGRLGEPDEVAAATAFLSSSAGAFITGEILDVNGGLIVD